MKKVIALVLIICIMTTLMVGCGTKNASEATSQTTSKTDASVEEALSSDIPADGHGSPIVLLAALALKLLHKKKASN